MARSCRAGSLGRDLLNTGVLVCRVESFEGRGGDESEYTSVFLHVALMYWSPVRPTFVELACVKDDPTHRW